MTMTGVSGWMFSLVPAHPGCPDQSPESRKMGIVVVAINWTIYNTVYPKLSKQGCCEAKQFELSYNLHSRPHFGRRVVAGGHCVLVLLDQLTQVGTLQRHIMTTHNTLHSHAVSFQHSSITSSFSCLAFIYVLLMESWEFCQCRIQQCRQAVLEKGY